MFRNLTLSFFALGLAVLLAEFALRVLTPSSSGNHRANVADLIVGDETLGWRLKPGTYRYTRDDGSKSIVTVRENGTRANAQGCQTCSESIYMIGGSFVAGSQFLNNTDTIPAQLATRLDKTRLINLGVYAYGTVQSFLRLTEFIKDNGKPNYVIYGLVDFHQYRNVAHGHWHRGLSWKTETPVTLPYATIGESGKLSFMPGEPYPENALTRGSQLASRIQNILVDFKRKPRIERSREITVSVIEHMKTWLSERDIPLTVAYLEAANESPSLFIDALRKSDISFIDCTDARLDLENPIIAEDGHPSQRLNRAWAECIQLHF